MVYTQLNEKTVLFQTIQFNLSTQFKHTFKWWKSKFQIIHFRVITQFSSIWPIERNLSGATTPGHSGPGINGNKGVFRIPQSCRIIGTSLSDCLVSYPGNLLWEFYPSVEMTESSFRYEYLKQFNCANKWLLLLSLFNNDIYLKPCNCI